MVKYHAWYTKTLYLKYLGNLTTQDLKYSNSLYSDERLYKLKYIVNDLSESDGYNFDDNDIKFKASYNYAASTQWRTEANITQIFVTNDPKFMAPISDYAKKIRQLNFNWRVLIAPTIHEAKELTEQNFNDENSI